MKENEIVYIYKITNLKNGNIYIGQTQNIKTRFAQHKKEARGKSSLKIHIAMREYGFDNFTIEEIDNCFFKHRYIIEEH